MRRPWRWWALAALAAGAAGAGVAWLGAPDTIKLPTGVGTRQQQQQQAPRGTQPLTPRPAPPLTADAPPPGIDMQRWQSLQRELAGRPDELQRVVAHLQYAATLQRFRAERSLPLAQALDAGLDDRLQRREVGAAEARHIKSALLAVLLPDAPARQTALARWDASHARAAAADPRDARFLRRQADVIAAWQQQSAASRDPQALQRDLDALRQTHYDTPGGEPR